MRISDELLNLWEESRGTENVGNGIFNDPQWKEEWYLVYIFY